MPCIVFSLLLFQPASFSFCVYIYMKKKASGVNLEVERTVHGQCEINTRITIHSTFIFQHSLHDILKIILHIPVVLEPSINFNKKNRHETKLVCHKWDARRKTNLQNIQLFVQY